MSKHDNASWMARTNTRSILLIGATALTLSLSGCMWFIPEGAAPVDEILGRAPGRVDGYVEFLMINDASGEELVASANIGSDGSFLIDLDDVAPPANTLFPIPDWAGIELDTYDTMTISDLEAQMTLDPISGIAVYDPTDTLVGSVLLFDGPTISTAIGPGAQVRWLYADRDVTIEGVAYPAGPDTSYNFWLVMLEGWNQVVITIAEDLSQVLYETAEIPEGVDWYFLP